MGDERSSGRHVPEHQYHHDRSDEPDLLSWTSNLLQVLSGSRCLFYREKHIEDHLWVQSGNSSDVHEGVVKLADTEVPFVLYDLFLVDILLFILVCILKVGLQLESWCIFFTVMYWAQ